RHPRGRLQHFLYAHPDGTAGREDGDAPASAPAEDAPERCADSLVERRERLDAVRRDAPSLPVIHERLEQALEVAVAIGPSRGCLEVGEEPGEPLVAGRERRKESPEDPGG